MQRLQLLEAGSPSMLAADPVKLKDAVTWAAAAGALTCTRPGAIQAQPSKQEVDQLVSRLASKAA